MSRQLRKIFITTVGGFLTIIGLLFVLVPGPAFLFLPVGLAVLALEYPIARVWLKKAQRLMRAGAIQMDAFIRRFTRRKR